MVIPLKALTSQLLHNGCEARSTENNLILDLIVVNYVADLMQYRDLIVRKATFIVCIGQLTLRTIECSRVNHLNLYSNGSGTVQQ